MRKVCIIAEAGVNHNGNISTAKKMVDVAKECKVDIIKFQTFQPELLVSRQAQQAEYQIKNTCKIESQLEMLRRLTLTEKEYIEIADYCKRQKISFLSTPFDRESIKFLKKFKMPFWKIPSGEITNYPYLVELAMTHQPIVMSTGMSNVEEIEEAIRVLQEHGSGAIRLLHCNTEYPTPFSDVNLRAMQTLREKFCVEVGYSDHTQGIEVPIAAVALGATIIEKHFTLDRMMEGPDHKASLEPAELAEMVQEIRNIELAMGDGRKQPSESEQKNMLIARKSIVASKAIREGDIFTEDNITTKRPGSGINPMQWAEVLGQTANRDYEEDELITR
ncbi:MAG: N-acetylneuraminate synthase [Lachnospiraceae bacterium]